MIAERIVLTTKPVVILGAGINGAALARELLLNGVPVILIDRADIASGTTAYSSRLIHGGLRYLEYGQLSLVRESLAERRRLLELAPQFVQPLELQIPVWRRGGGWLSSMAKFVGAGQGGGRRGLWLIRSGLWMYDRLARDRQLPGHRVLVAGSPEAIPVADGCRWLCSYWDAQIAFPERFVVALLQDARQIAHEAGLEFSLYTYHRAHRAGGRLEIRPAGVDAGEPVRVIEPAAIVNATGAWLDHTLRELDILTTRKIGGTKGTHFLTFHPPLVEMLAGRGLYAEAADGRPVFVLPLRDAVLVGTTDIPFDGDPAEAVASEAELEYLLGVVRRLLPQLPLNREDIRLHYAGVRPLPYSGDKRPGAISRRHWLERHPGGSMPLFSLIGGKLTTCRSLAEEAAGQVLAAIGKPRVADSRQRSVPDPDGTCDPSDEQTGNCLYGTDVPLGRVARTIDREWVSCLDDLVERRLMLLYHPRLSIRCLQQLAELLVKAGKLSPHDQHSAIAATILRLQDHYGMRLE